MSALFSLELQAHFKIAKSYMCRELFSERSEFLCLDKVTSCTKVGQRERLYDCMLFPYDAIQYKANEKLS